MISFELGETSMRIVSFFSRGIKELFTDAEYKSLNYKYSPAKIQNLCITLTFEEVIKFLKNC